MSDDRDKQIFFDRDADSFLSEVIGVMKPIKIHIDIKHTENRAVIKWPEGKTVRLQFEGAIPGQISDWMFACTVFGRSYGECLYLCREKIRTG